MFNKYFMLRVFRTPKELLFFMKTKKYLSFVVVPFKEKIFILLKLQNLITSLFFYLFTYLKKTFIKNKLNFVFDILSSYYFLHIREDALNSQKTKKKTILNTCLFLQLLFLARS